ncbi:phosphatase PAP2 family protein [Shewanella schlegeliana]|uniref:undecaprenyl-diphosphate phosphatase n=1 Tax=Shewanella schlegeliana TaxID=190308 RepID=A0ABS1T637_9GAMM|nr:phosphatase PAP2 family protein [Shewanella schlegeliana]
MLAAWCLLLTIPAIIYLGSITLFPTIALDSNLAQALYWLTSTGTAPYGIATGILILIVCYRRLTKQQFMQLVLAVSISMAATLSLNHFLKPYFAEPRPNATLLEQEYLLNTQDFYQQSKADKREQLGRAINQLEVARPDLSLSPQIKRHWQHEVGYAFPSGHTLFAVTLALAVSFYLLLAGQVILPILLMGWAITMGFSRMLLGMHWPQDVLASTAIGGSIAFSSIYLTQALWPTIDNLFISRLKTA